MKRIDHFTGACAPEWKGVETAVQNAFFVGKNASTDQSNLLAKLEAAAAKIRLSNSPKPKLEDATELNGAVVTAIGCIGTL